LKAALELGAGEKRRKFGLFSSFEICAHQQSSIEQDQKPIGKQPEQARKWTITTIV
jgi:hypothetical protein